MSMYHSRNDTGPHIVGNLLEISSEVRNHTRQSIALLHEIRRNMRKLSANYFDTSLTTADGDNLYQVQLECENFDKNLLKLVALNRDIEALAQSLIQPVNLIIEKFYDVDIEGEEGAGPSLEDYDG